MLFSIFEQGASFIRKQARHKRWLVVCVCLALVAASGTILALKLNGQAMTHKQKVLQCEYHVHAHEKSCYDQETKELICGYADYVVHTHNVDCYNDSGTLMCVLPEVEEHKHDKSCYQDQSVLICTEAESAGHQHTAECYQEERGELACGLIEHQHEEACYDEAGEIVCGLESHSHDDSCYGVNSVLICDTEEGSGGHNHSDSCYETRTVLACGKLENHTHDEKACYDKDGNLTCQEIVLEEHVHNSDCFVTVELTPEEVAALNQPSPSPEIFFTDEEGSELEEAGSDLEENTADPEQGSSLEEGSSLENDALLDFPFKKTAKLGTLTVTAGYYEKAEIPEEAELEVALISDEAETAECLSAAEEWIAPKDKTWLYDIGFYLDGEEIQPEDTVYVTMQVAEDWLRAGTPVSVVHFVKDEPVLLEASALKETEDGSFATEFDVETFSRFLLILGEAPKEPEKPETVKTDYELSDTFDYETDNFTMKIQVDGVATLETPAETAQAETEDSAEESGETLTAGLKTEDAPENEAEAEPEKTVFTTEPEDANEETETAAPGDKTVKNTAEEGSAAEPDGDGKLTAEDVDFSVELLDEDDPLYQAFEAALDARAQETAAKAANDEAEEGSAVEDSAEDEVTLLALSVMRFNFELDGAALDISKCEITAEVTLKEQAFAAVEIPEDAAIEAEPSISLTAMEIVDENKAIIDVETLETMAVSQSENMPMLFSVNNGVMALSEEDATNFTYQVQYYANLYRIQRYDNMRDGSQDFHVLDTSGRKTSAESPTVYLKLTEAGEVFEEKKLSKIYTNETVSYLERPGLDYIKLLPSGANDNYSLNEIWVWNGTGTPDSKDDKNWTVYDDVSTVVLSNTAGTDPEKTYIVLSDTSVVRLVYEPNSGTRDISAMFHDYDISEDGTFKWKQDGNVRKGTTADGINSKENSSNANRLAFGNQNGSALGDKPGNKAGTDFGKCTFGLVTGLNADGTPIFKNDSAKLFGEDTQHGKTTIMGYNLNFDRVGDTYTLSSVTAPNGTAVADGLKTFVARDKWGGGKLYANDFWPMDQEQGIDPHFGENNTAFAPYGSDDGKNHNAYFGMQYSVSFTLDSEYEGPLEYLFYGDDDMWVFLDGKQLIVDLGGVHQSAGVFVNLWDYIPQGTTGEHTLSVFFTERGASGSTCYMQFTLPSVKAISPLASRGSLEISKTVDGPDTTGSFAFELTLSDETKYTAYVYNRKTGEQVSKQDFQKALNVELKHNEYLVINNIMKDTAYTLKEAVYDGYTPTIMVDGEERFLDENGSISDTIVGLSGVSISYTNHTTRVLPETGGADIKPIYAIGGAVIFMAVLLYGGMLWRRRKCKSVSES